ncbi:MAG: hypothetical protein NWF13_08595 [Candidatus Bathyarchaeota archaeon]|nr:hypothetical protein [Candidatus Bathyarchaeota archaeon]
MAKTFRQCSPECDAFRCGQRALTFQGRRAYCRWADDVCTGGTCNYALCVKSKLLPKGVCGQTIRRKTSDAFDPEAMEEPQIRLKGKILRRFRPDDIL